MQHHVISYTLLSQRLVWRQAESVYCESLLKHGYALFELDGVHQVKQGGIWRDGDRKVQSAQVVGLACQRKRYCNVHQS